MAVATAGGRNWIDSWRQNVSSEEKEYPPSPAATAGGVGKTKPANHDDEPNNNCDGGAIERMNARVDPDDGRKSKVQGRTRSPPSSSKSPVSTPTTQGQPASSKIKASNQHVATPSQRGNKTRPRSPSISSISTSSSSG
ncbi:hypothetical protein HK104_002730, partial [Borealophlyctis nickersoniae]